MPSKSGRCASNSMTVLCREPLGFITPLQSRLGTEPDVEGEVPLEAQRPHGAAADQLFDPSAEPPRDDLLARLAVAGVDLDQPVLAPEADAEHGVEESERLLAPPLERARQVLRRV